MEGFKRPKKVRVKKFKKGRIKLRIVKQLTYETETHSSNYKLNYSAPTPNSYYICHKRIVIEYKKNTKYLSIVRIRKKYRPSIEELCEKAA